MQFFRGRSELSRQRVENSSEEPSSGQLVTSLRINTTSSYFLGRLLVAFLSAITDNLGS